MSKSIAFKFFLSLSGVLFGFSLMFGLWTQDLVEQSHVERTKTVNAKDIQMHARRLLRPKSFVLDNTEASREQFVAFFNAIRTSEIVRLKVWDADSRVVFSDFEPIIGQRFSDDEELQEALEGQVVAKIKEPISPENIGEREYANMDLLEEYVPIYFEGDAKPVGAVEVYFNMDSLNALVTRVRWLIFSALLMVSAGIFITAGFFFWFLVRKRLVLLVNAAHEVAGGNLDVRVMESGADEIGALTKAFNAMTKKLKESRESLEKKVRDRTEKLERDNKIMVGRELKIVELKKEVEDLKGQIKSGTGKHKNS